MLKTRIEGFVGPSKSSDTAGPNGVLTVPQLGQLWAARVTAASRWSTCNRARSWTPLDRRQGARRRDGGRRCRHDRARRQQCGRAAFRQPHLDEARSQDPRQDRLPLGEKRPRAAARTKSPSIRSPSVSISRRAACRAVPCSEPSTPRRIAGSPISRPQGTPIRSLSTRSPAGSSCR